MMKKRRTRTCAILLAVVLLLSSCDVTPHASTLGAGVSDGDKPAVALEGASIVLKVSHPDNDTSMMNTWNCYARTFKNFVETYSGGEMTCDIFPNDQLGDLTSCMEQCSQGSVDVALSAASGNLASWIPNISVFDIPYIVDNIDACNLVLQGEVLTRLNNELSSAANMQILSAFQTGFRNLDTWNAPVYTVDDVKGLKLRLQEIDSHILMAECWGAIPTTVAFSELYSAASTGVIDAFDNCNYTLFMKKLEEVTKYITETQHLANVCTALISNKTLETLTEEQQDIIWRAAADARRATIGVVYANEVNITAQLKEAGVELITLTDEQKATFKDACFEQCMNKILETVDQDFYDLFVKEYELAEQFLGLV